MKARGLAGLLRRECPPLAVLQHPALVVLGDGPLAGLAAVDRALGPPPLPLQLLEAQPLARPAVRAGHEVAALIGGRVLALDRARPGDGRGGDDEELFPGEGAGPGLGQGDGIALALDVQRVAVHLVEEQVAHRHRAQADRRVGAGHHQHPALELLGEDGVAGVAAARRGDALGDRGGLLQERVDALLGGALGHLHRRPDRHHRPRGVVDDVADPVEPELGAPDLGPLHEHHPLDGGERGETVHDRPQIGRAAGAPAPGLG